MGLKDSSGQTVVAYVYDAWGRLLSTEGDMQFTLGLDNPLRYRGYVYDHETGLYYLESRYYNPTIGRFINADNLAYLGADGTPLSYNLYAYCGNNPVMGYDSTGNWNEKFVLGGGLFLIGVAIILAVPTGGLSLSVAGVTLSIGTSTAVATGASIALVGIAISGDAIMDESIMYARKTRKSGKEKANDFPSYFDRNGVDPNKTAQQNAADALDRQFGKGNWPRDHVRISTKLSNGYIEVCRFCL